MLFPIWKKFLEIEQIFNYTRFTDGATEPRADWDRGSCGPVFSWARRKLPWTDCGRDADRWVSYIIRIIFKLWLIKFLTSSSFCLTFDCTWSYCFDCQSALTGTGFDSSLTVFRFCTSRVIRRIRFALSFKWFLSGSRREYYLFGGKTRRFYILPKLTLLWKRSEYCRLRPNGAPLLAVARL